MKKCPNPDCPSYQQGREFFDDDTICPRCGEVLVNPGLAGGAAPYPAYAVATAARSRPIEHGHAILGAAATLLGVFILIGLLVRLGALHQRVIVPINLSPVAVVTPLPGQVSLGLTPDIPANPPTAAARAVATAQAAATLTARPTPIGGIIVATSVAGGVQSLPTLPPGFGGNGQGGPSNPAQLGTPGAGGLAGTNPANGALAIASELCQRLDAGGRCDAVSSYSPSDSFYIAVQATFGDNLARTIRVRLYGPPNGERDLLNQDQTNTPGRDGRFWVGFAFSQSSPWTPGIYRADIYVNNDTQRTSYISWTVNQ